MFGKDSDSDTLAVTFLKFLSYSKANYCFFKKIFGWCVSRWSTDIHIALLLLANWKKVSLFKFNPRLIRLQPNPSLPSRATVECTVHHPYHSLTLSFPCAAGRGLSILRVDEIWVGKGGAKHGEGALSVASYNPPSTTHARCAMLTRTAGESAMSLLTHDDNSYRIWSFSRSEAVQCSIVLPRQNNLIGTDPRVQVLSLETDTRSPPFFAVF